MIQDFVGGPPTPLVPALWSGTSNQSAVPKSMGRQGVGPARDPAFRWAFLLSLAGDSFRWAFQ